MDSPLNDSIIFDVMKRVNKTLHERKLLYAHDAKFTNVLFVRGTEGGSEWRDSILGARNQALLQTQTAQVIEYLNRFPGIQHVVGHSRGAAIAHDAAHKMKRAFCGVDGAMVLCRAPGGLKARNINKTGVIDRVLDPIGPLERTSDGTEANKWDRTHHAELGRYTDNFNNKIGDKPMEDIATGFEYGGPNVRQGSVKREHAQAFSGEENLPYDQSIIGKAGEVVGVGVKKIRMTIKDLKEFYNNNKAKYAGIRDSLNAGFKATMVVLKVLSAAMGTKYPDATKKLNDAFTAVDFVRRNVKMVTDEIEDIDKKIEGAAELAKMIGNDAYSAIEAKIASNINALENRGQGIIDKAISRVNDGLQVVNEVQEELSKNPDIQKLRSEFSNATDDLVKIEKNIRSMKDNLLDKAEYVKQRMLEQIPR